jgi:hypothetical protein
MTDSSDLFLIPVWKKREVLKTVGKGIKSFDINGKYSNRSLTVEEVQIGKILS